MQDESFLKVKHLITEAPVLAFYDVTRTTIVSADASSYGLAEIILQDHDDHELFLSKCSVQSRNSNTA